MKAARDSESLLRTAQSIEAPIGRYYEALARDKTGTVPASFDLAALYERHKPRALLSIAQSFRHAGDLNRSSKLTFEARDRAISHCDWNTVAHAQKELAILRSIDGDYEEAFRLITNIRPVVLGTGDTALIADYHNSLAVAHNDLGRIEEARGAISVALASPFVNAYPEWRETLAEIEARGRVDRSTVSFAAGAEEARDSQFGSNVVQLALRANPEFNRNPETQPPDAREPARVLSFQGALAMVKKKAKEEEAASPPPPDASVREKEMELLRLLLDGEWDAEAINCITGVVQTTPNRRALIAAILHLPEEQVEHLMKKLRS